MSRTVIELENVCKYYRLGTIGGATLSEDINAWWAKIRGKENPLLTIGEKDYGNQEGEYIWALRDINLKVEQGDILGIIGANGAGKSTLLKILSRITGPTSGKVKIKGRIGSLLEVGTGFHPELTGRENVYLNGAILGMRRHEIDKKFDEIVDFSGVEKYIDTPVKRYSSGMRVRLGFAVAAHLDPEILVVDEVLAVGDLDFQKKCLGKMGSIGQSGRTVIYVSHNMNSVLALCNKAILLDKGQMSMIGSVKSVVDQYVGLDKISPSEIYITELNHGKSINKVRVNKFKLLNSASNNFSVYWKQPIHVVIEIEVLESVNRISFGLGVQSSDGVPIISLHQTDEASDFLSLDPGKYHIEVILENDLRPGKYRLGIGAHEEFVYNNLYYLPDIANIEVLDFGVNEELPKQYNVGIVNGSAQWIAPKKINN